MEQGVEHSGAASFAANPDYFDRPMSAASLGDDHGSAFAVKYSNIRNRDQALDRVSERGDLGDDPRGHLLDDRAQLIDAAQDDAAEEPVVVV